MFSIRLRPKSFMLFVNALMLAVLSVLFARAPSESLWWQGFYLVLFLGVGAYFMRALVCFYFWLADFGSTSSQRHVDQMAAHMRLYCIGGGVVCAVCLTLRTVFYHADIEILLPMILIGLWGMTNVMLSLGAIGFLYLYRVGGKGYGDIDREIERKLFGEDIS